jgi:hypothetical protein
MGIKGKKSPEEKMGLGRGCGLKERCCLGVKMGLRKR